jgi:hypothetical protein
MIVQRRHVDQAEVTHQPLAVDLIEVPGLDIAMPDPELLSQIRQGPCDGTRMTSASEMFTGVAASWLPRPSPGGRSARCRGAR